MVSGGERFAYFNEIKGQILFEWLDSEKKAVGIVQGVGNTGYEVTSENLVKNISWSKSVVLHSYATVPYINVEDGNIMVYVHSELTGDLTWQIRGLIK